MNRPEYLKPVPDVPLGDQMKALVSQLDALRQQRLEAAMVEAAEAAADLADAVDASLPPGIADRALKLSKLITAELSGIEAVRLRVGK